MIVLGIDPGLKGAIASLDDRGLYVDAIFMPTLQEKKGKKLHNRIDGWKIAHYLSGGANPMAFIAGIEAVHSMPGQGVSSSFNFGKGAGVIEGILTALQINFKEITPQSWKKYFGLSSDKNDSRLMASQLWPNLSFSRVKDEALAEALLIAEFTRLKFLVESVK